MHNSSLMKRLSAWRVHNEFWGVASGQYEVCNFSTTFNELGEHYFLHDSKDYEFQSMVGYRQSSISILQGLALIFWTFMFWILWVILEQLQPNSFYKVEQIDSTMSEGLDVCSYQPPPFSRKFTEYSPRETKIWNLGIEKFDSTRNAHMLEVANLSGWTEARSSGL